MKTLFLKYEWPLLIFGLVLILTFVPLMVSAANTILNLIGVAYIVVYVIWVINAIVRISHHFE